MRIVEQRGHSDMCSGLYILDDGTHIHYSTLGVEEGDTHGFFHCPLDRSSEVNVIRPNGRHERYPVCESSPLVDLITKAREVGTVVERRKKNKTTWPCVIFDGDVFYYRPMSPIEEVYHDAIRNMPNGGWSVPSISMKE
jgi:hypothetical protein